jgi:hypothetical protein
MPGIKPGMRTSTNQLGVGSPPSGAVGGLLSGLSFLAGLSAVTAVCSAARPAATAAAFAAFFATFLSCEGLGACLGLLGVFDAALALLAFAAERAFVADRALAFDRDAFERDAFGRDLVAVRFAAFFLLVFLDAFLMHVSLQSILCPYFHAGATVPRSMR